MEDKLIQEIEIFKKVIDGCLRNEDLVKVLNSLPLTKNIYEDLYLCYTALVENGFFPAEELDLLKSWVTDCKVTLGN